MNIESYDNARNHYVNGTEMMKKNWLSEADAEFRKALTAVERDEENLESPPDVYFRILKRLSDVWVSLFELFGTEYEQPKRSIIKRNSPERWLTPN